MTKINSTVLVNIAKHNRRIPKFHIPLMQKRIEEMPITHLSGIYAADD